MTMKTKMMKKTNNKRFRSLATFLVLLLCLSVCGCSLAREDAGSDNLSGDRLIGVVAADELAAKAINEQLNDEFTFSGGEIQSVTAGRLYATLQNSEQGGSEYVFPNVGGMQLYAATITDENHESFIAASGNGDEGFSDVHLAINSPSGVELTANIIVMRESAILMQFFPVWQQADGAVYLCSGNSMSFDSSFGGSCSYNYKSTFEATDYDGVKTTQESRIDISLIGMKPTVGYIISEFSESGELLRTKRISSLPETGFIYEAVYGCAYLIVERTDTAGLKTRALYEPSEDAVYLSLVFGNERGIGLQREYEVNFGE